MEREMRERAYRAVDDFCDGLVTEENIKVWCASSGVPHDVYTAFYESDLGSYCLLPRHGGWDGPFIARVWAAARLARRAGAVMPFQTDFNSMALLSAMQPIVGEGAMDGLVTGNGQIVFSQAFSEGGLNDDDAASGTRVSEQDGVVFLNGQKGYVSNGQFVPETLVLTSDDLFGGDDGGLSLWLVPLDAEGVSTSPLNTVGQEMTAPAMIEFDRVELREEWRVPTGGKLRDILDRQYALGRILTCAASWGLAQAAFDDTIARANARNVRGGKLGRLPQVEIMLAEMAAKLRSMGALVEKAARSVSEDVSFDELQLDCSLMKFQVPKAATEVADAALQVFGGVGYTDRTRLGRIWRDCRGNQIAQGSNEMMVHTVAKRLLADYASGMRDL